MGATALMIRVIVCGEWDVALSLELAIDLPIERAMVRYGGQGNVGALLEAQVKYGCDV